MTTTLQLAGDYYDRAHEINAALRANGPAHPVTLQEGLSVWVVTRYADARDALADPRLRKDIAGLGAIMRKQLGMPVDAPLPGMYRDTILYKSGPQHMQERRSVARAFSPRRIEALRPRITQFTIDTLRALPQDRPVDLIQELAYPLPLTVICELLGVPIAERPSLRRWTSALVQNADQNRAQTATEEMEIYLSQLVNRKRIVPGDDLISTLLAGDDDQRLSHDQLVSTLTLLIVAGHDTTTSLIGNAIFHLLADPHRWTLLRNYPALIPSAIDELIRYDAPVAMATHRYTTEAVTYGDPAIPGDQVTIPPGQIVLISLLSAGRDNQQFGPDADALNLHRDASGHLGFGHGPHYCLGAMLGKLEAEVVLSTLTQQFPDAALAVDGDTLKHGPSVIIHGLQELPVCLRR